eukprot:CAMPEP_0195288644 /NCGR_PEP_ID=MMETSP0707-20130614/5229_1 /TAXON_ID=33640 /ORGANISM="Asterionellopsis glacialis, Strain CCMP134" /LENGTH=365 /DNA_ID=CAMNT_0040348541 /DNA_START=103 /DNA_END=1200 /DNA_ORIENTATION=+
MLLVGKSVCRPLSCHNTLIRCAILRDPLGHYFNGKSSPAKSYSTRETANVPTSPSSLIATQHLTHHTNGILSAGFQPTAITRNGVYVGSTFLEFPPCPLPELDVSALMDKRRYGLRAAAKYAGTRTKTNGSDAAIRLIQGQQKLLDTMQQEFEQSNRRYYMLKGHGVPTQLLQYHLDTAHNWFEQHVNARELAVENVFGVLKADRLVVQAIDGTDRTLCFPQERKADMELYLAVMNRMALHLSAFLEDQHPQDDTDSDHPHTKEYVPQLKEWSVSILKEQAISPALIPSHLELTPVVELTRMKRRCSSSEGRVCIRLQGPVTTTTTTRGGRPDVSNRSSTAIIFHGIVDMKPGLHHTEQKNFRRF